MQQTKESNKDKYHMMFYVNVIIMNPLRIEVFLSYHTDDKVDALKVTIGLKQEGMGCFLAPDDIVGGTNFRKVLQDKVKSSNVFVPLISQKYHRSNYSDQELGIALGLDKPVIPVCLDSTLPYGLIDGIQCICSNGADISTKIPKLVESIHVVTDSGKNYVNWCIKNLAESNSFASAAHWTQKIEKIPQFTREQIEKISYARSNNNQVSDSWNAAPILDRILKGN